ncbi:lipoyl(octanoyl) transferase LipB [Smaragdicoccus niigatensis]
MVVSELGLVDYVPTWELQRQTADRVAAGTAPDHLFLLEHHSVYTAGRRTADDERPTDGTPVIDVDRGGKITWHGPGQLVGYPIIKLAEPIDVVDYVRRLEEALIAVCAEFGVDGGRVDGRSGVWLPGTSLRPERKIAAIGVRVQRGVTLHGFAINCNSNVNAFGAIVPCGIRDAGVTSLSLEAGRAITVADVLPVAQRYVVEALNGDLAVAVHAVARG